LRLERESEGGREQRKRKKYFSHIRWITWTFTA
jgi:hypothetical protein